MPLSLNQRAAQKCSNRVAIATTTASAGLVPAVPLFAKAERLTMAGLLAGSSGLTREACELDLRKSKTIAG